VKFKFEKTEWRQPVKRAAKATSYTKEKFEQIWFVHENSSWLVNFTRKTG